jgi:hypothetical protein
MTDQQRTAEPITPDIDRGDLGPRHGDAGHTDRSDAVIREALDVIDGALAQMMRRDLVSSGEVADLLLDVRSLLTAPAHQS